MTRLGTYLVKMFLTEAMALFGVVLCLLFLIKVLGVADVASVRSEGIGILLVQAVLSMLPLATAFLYACLAIGLARSLRQLQASHELHMLHVGQQLGELFKAIGIFTFGGAIAVLLLAHVVEPAATRMEDRIKAEVAAELVGTKLVPNRFAEVSPQVTVTVGGRQANGEITSFFADDRRSPDTRRTYIAQSAVLAQDEFGYVLQLQNGSIQYRTAGGQFSEVSFARYDIALDRLTGATDTGERRSDLGSLALITSGTWDDETAQTLAKRTAEGIRVLALCIFVTALCVLPSGRRRARVLPIEIVVLGAAFFERSISLYLPVREPFASWSGSVLLLAVSTAVLVYRLRLLVPSTHRARVA